MTGACRVSQRLAMCIRAFQTAQVATIADANTGDKEAKLGRLAVVLRLCCNRISRQCQHPHGDSNRYQGSFAVHACVLPKFISADFLVAQLCEF